MYYIASVYFIYAKSCLEQTAQRHFLYQIGCLTFKMCNPICIVLPWNCGLFIPCKIYTMLSSGYETLFWPCNVRSSFLLAVFSCFSWSSLPCKSNERVRECQISVFVAFHHHRILSSNYHLIRVLRSF